MKKIFIAFLTLVLIFAGTSFGQEIVQADALTIYDPEAYTLVLATFIQIPCQEEDYDEWRCDRPDETYYDSELDEEVLCTEEDYVDETCYAGTTTYEGVEEHVRVQHGDVASVEFGKLYDALSLELSEEVDLDHGFFFSYTELFYLPEGVGGPRESRQGIWDVQTGFSEEGIYEFDVYGGIGGMSRAPSLMERLAHAFIPYAHAEGTDGGNGPYLTTVRFEIRDANAPEGNPSVLFLPGTQASRLYDGDDGNRIWEPSGNSDVAKLALDASGNSIENVQTKDVIDEIDVIPFLQSNIYKGFMSYLDGLVEDGVIEAWEPFAYDWRRSVFDVVENGTTYYDGTNEGEQKYLVDLVEELAANSQNGKVAIIGHSNGGLLAKSLMMKLEQEGRDDLIDSVIFIATPHLGTPKAIATVLHGHDQQKVGGLLIDDEVARDVIKNMPGAYALLPSEKYMEVTGQPLITFKDSSVTQDFIDFYGTTISGIAEFLDFMNGADGRDASGIPINEPSVANTNMLLDALEDHAQKLDTWVAPDHVEVYEIVGTGLATIKSIEYREMTEALCPPNSTSVTLACSLPKKLKPYAELSFYGDETVISLSADGYFSNKVRVFLDFQKLRRVAGISLLSGYEHSNITETDSVQKLISRILQRVSLDGVEFISDIPAIFDEPYNIISVHSPVKIKVTDEDGKVTGVDSNNAPKEEIPGSSYFELGGSKYVVVPVDIDYDVVLEGEGDGGYTLIIDTLENGDEQENLHTAENMLVSSTTIATFKKEGDSFSTIIVDQNGDGEPDAEFTVDGEEVAAEEPTPQELLQEYRETVDGMNVSSTIKRNFKLSALVAEDLINKNRIYFAKLSIEAMKMAVKFRENMRQISKTDARILLDILLKVEQELR